MTTDPTPPASAVPLQYGEQPRRSRVTRVDAADAVSFVIPPPRLWVPAAWLLALFVLVVAAGFATGHGAGQQPWHEWLVDSAISWCVLLAIVLVPVWLFRRRQRVSVSADGLTVETRSVVSRTTRRWAAENIGNVAEVSGAVAITSPSGGVLGKVTGLNVGEAQWLACTVRQRLRPGP